MFQLKQEWSLEFLDGTPEFPQEDSHNSRGIIRTPKQKERAPCTTNELDMRADSLVSTQEECQLSTSTSRGGFSQLYVREWDTDFASEWEWTMRCTDSKEGQITLQWLECWLVFLLKRNMDV